MRSPGQDRYQRAAPCERDRGDHLSIERSRTGFHLADEAFVRTPIEVAQAFPFGEPQARGPLVGEVHQFGAVDLIVAGRVAEVVGTTRQGNEFAAQGFSAFCIEGRRAVHLNPRASTPNDPLQVGSPADVPEGLDDVPPSIALHEDAAVGPWTAGHAFDGIDEGAAGQRLEDDIALVFLRGESLGDTVDAGDRSRREENEKQCPEADPGGDSAGKDLETGEHVHGNVRCSEAWTEPGAMRHGIFRWLAMGWGETPSNRVGAGLKAQVPSGGLRRGPWGLVLARGSWGHSPHP